VQTPGEEDKPSPSKVAKLNWMKAGIQAADKVLTVSPNYASEISSGPSKGVEMDAILRAAGGELRLLRLLLVQGVAGQASAAGLLPVGRACPAAPGPRPARCHPQHPHPRRPAGVEGIVNGMDVEEWNPRTDKFLDINYDRSTVFQGKAAAKSALQVRRHLLHLPPAAPAGEGAAAGCRPLAAPSPSPPLPPAAALLQAELGLPVDPSVPLFGFIGRLEEQKGLDILVAALPKVLRSGNVQVSAAVQGGAAQLAVALSSCLLPLSRPPCAPAPPLRPRPPPARPQVAILGTGKKAYEKLVADLSKAFPGKAAGVVKFSAPLAHQITAGADFMLVPSRFEPCGLIQLHAMQYGTVPLVSSTGGLVDTVKEGVTGFHMGAMDTDKLEQVRAQGGGLPGGALAPCCCRLHERAACRATAGGERALRRLPTCPPP
jgi:granule-bound starch synthase